MRRSALPALSALLSLVIVGPLLGGGFVLNYDMVFSPTQPLVPDSLGLGSAPARSVPADAVIAGLTHVLPGDLVQKLILFLAFFLGPLGAGRLVPTESTGVRLVAAVGYGWTAYLAERLFMGHWPYLLAYACLPWIAAAGLALRRGEPKAWVRLVVWSAPAVLTPSGGLLAAGTAFAATGWRRALPTLAVVTVMNAPWWVPSVLRPGVSSPDAVALFDARAENWGGAVTSVLGLGGYWNSEVVPASRELPLVPILTIAVTVVALLGFRELARRWEPAAAILGLGALGVFLAVLGTIPVGAEILRWAVSEIPGAGLLRDAQKWVAWWALPLALGFAVATEQAARHLPRGRLAVFAAAALLPVVSMPDLAFAGLGRLETVHYPQDWADVRGILLADDQPGDVLTLPLSTFRRFAWNGDRTQLDPAPRILPKTTVIDDTVHVGGRPVAGEDTRLPPIRETLAAHGDLGAVGIGWVLVEHGTPGVVDPEVLAPLAERYGGEWLTLYRVPGPMDTATAVGPTRFPVLLADFSALLIVTVSWLWLALPTGRLSGLTRREE
ncbi:hypothetical protein GPZ80_08870 [Actinokineospora sp. HBU206404]|uniref:Membrane protein YfhO n=1 Tax=Actinokineospora xionganensis TaxID=2684470 RepID=A0ABR7L3L5_9PSEU|nr:hypothetical protein [Actinokineospora xionganensis]